MFRIPRPIVLVVIVALILSGCTGLFKGKPVAGTTGMVTGQVLGKSDKPLPGIPIAIEGTSYTSVTDSDGNFHLANVPVGSHTLVATYPVAPFSNSSPQQDQNVQRLGLVLDEGTNPFFVLGDEVVSPSVATNSTYTTHTMAVTVHPQATTTVDVALPISDPLERVTLVAANPPLGQTIPPGEKVDVVFDVDYTLTSQEQGAVAIVMFAELTDADIRSFTDTDIEYGKTYYYRLVLETLDDQLHESADIQAQSITQTLINTAIRSVQQLITDRVRDKVYMLSNGRIGVISADTGSG